VIGVQVPGVAPHTLGVRLPHVWPAAHPPQSTWPPQPLPTTPQYLPPLVVHWMGEQAPESGGKPQRLVRPAPPHVCAPEQPPQSI
jgi:hypothetical protein